MKKFLFSLLAGACLVSAAGNAAADDSVLIQRGEYLAKAADCVACHTTEGGKPFAGGLAFKTPMGTLYSPNITPDKQTGIGNWSDEDFLNALHKGIGKNGEHLYPAFPYTSFASLSDEDVKAIRAYLMSLPAVHQPPKENQMPFPFNQRYLMAAWNLINFTPQNIDPQQDRGHYLAVALGHCAECHSPRTLTMGLNSSKYLGGGSVDGWTAFNITPDLTAGIGQWSVDDIKTYLKTGNLPGKAQAAGPMAEVIRNSTRFMTEEDLTALAQYLKTVPAIADTQNSRFADGNAHADPSVIMPRSQISAASNDPHLLFSTTCTTCHGISGQGTPDHKIPSLFHNSVTGAATPDNLALVILQGSKTTLNFNDASMPAFADELTDTQIATLVNYVRQQYGNADNPITPQRVGELRNGEMAASPLTQVMKYAVIAVVIVILLLAWVIIRKRKRQPRR